MFHYTFKTSLPLDALGLNGFNHPMKYRVNYVSSYCISSSSFLQVSGRTCHKSIETFNSGGTMLDTGSLSSQSSQHVGRCCWVMSCCKGSDCGCLGIPDGQESAISAFSPLAAWGYVLHRQGFSSYEYQAVVGATIASTVKVYQQWCKELAGWCAWEGLANNAMSAPKLADFLIHELRVGQAWHTIVFYCSAISAFLTSSSSLSFLSCCHL